jgi:hypothetical protein
VNKFITSLVPTLIIIICLVIYYYESTNSGNYVKVPPKCNTEQIVIQCGTISTNVHIVPYKHDSSVYSDRAYLNSEKELGYMGLKLLQIPRHMLDNLLIHVSANVVIYRALHENQEAPGYDVSGIPVNISGKSIDLNKLVVKKYPKGIIKIITGFPVVSSPIFIGHAKGPNNDLDIKIMAKY